MPLLVIGLAIIVRSNHSELLKSCPEVRFIQKSAGEGGLGKSFLILTRKTKTNSACLLNYSESSVSMVFYECLNLTGDG